MDEITFVYDNVELAYKEGRLIEHAGQLIRGMKTEAWELAETLYYLKASIVLEEGEEFKEWAAHEYGLNPYTIDRYVNVWKAVLTAPEEVKLPLLEKEINAVIPLGTNLANGGVEPEQIDWDRVEDIESNGEMRQMIREIKGIKEREGTITFQIRETGDILVWSGQQSEHIGFIERNPRTEFGKKAVMRLEYFLKGQ